MEVEVGQAVVAVVVNLSAQEAAREGLQLEEYWVGNVECELCSRCMYPIGDGQGVRSLGGKQFSLELGRN